ncbi:MAG: CCA tRNA nucleotidyltransferase [Phycisphaerales bacterium]
MVDSQDNSAQRSADDPRAAAVEIVRTLAGAGFEAYFAGGCVRDKLMGDVPDDYDVATDAKPDQVRDLFRRTQHVGESFGVVLVSLKGCRIEVATFRTDGVYSDGRHPDGVTFSDAQHDARRRDFTINGLFENPLTDEVIDYVAGQADLEAKVIRAIGDPHARLHEDRLRMLRAVRFAARFAFAIEEQTAEAIRAAAGDLRGVSRERIAQEVKRMLAHPNRGPAAQQLQDLGLDAAILGEPNLTVATTRLGQLPDSAPYATALAAWLLDRQAGQDSPLGDRARRWAGQLMLSNAQKQAMTAVLDIHEVLRGTWPELGVARQKRLASTPAFEEAMAILQTIDPQSFTEIRSRVLTLAETQLHPAPLIDGNDLVARGLTPGPAFKRVLDAVYDAQLEGSVHDKEAALALAQTVAGTLKPPAEGPSR